MHSLIGLRRQRSELETAEAAGLCRAGVWRRSVTEVFWGTYCASLTKDKPTSVQGKIPGDPAEIACRKAER